MTDTHRPRVKYVIGPDGSPLTIADLPPSNTKRWVIRRKAEVVAAVRGGLLSLEEACARYTLTVEEFLSWQRQSINTGSPACARRASSTTGNSRRSAAPAHRRTAPCRSGFSCGCALYPAFTIPPSHCLGETQGQTFAWEADTCRWAASGELSARRAAARRRTALTAHRLRARSARPWGAGRAMQARDEVVGG